MAILQLRSDNPNFSFIISKNPDSGMMLKSIRKGKAFGWYSGENSYNVYFKDADNEVSYQKNKDEQFEYLNVTRYNTPLFPLNAVGDFFSSASKSLHEYDTEGFANVLFVNMVSVEYTRYLEFFKSHFKDFDLQYEELAHKNFQITVSTKRTVHELLHYSNTLFLFLSMISSQYLVLEKEVLAKYIKSMNAIDAPYFIRYLFSKNLLKSRKNFKEFKEELQKSSYQEIELSFGGTAVQRNEWIQNKLSFDKPIVDVGCGEGAYAIPYSKKLGDIPYYAIDIDEEVREKLHRKVEVKNIENIMILESFHHYSEIVNNNERSHIIMTEVIEHMKKEKAQKLLRYIADSVNFDTFIITTPNADFNVFYEMDDFRHHDHKWEMGKDEFLMWIRDTFDENLYEIHYEGIGDSVNGIYTTQGVILKRKDEK